MVKVEIYGTPVWPELQKEIKQFLESAIKKQNGNNLVDYNEMSWDIAEGVQKFIESQDLQEK